MNTVCIILLISCFEQSNLSIWALLPKLSHDDGSVSLTYCFDFVYKHIWLCTYFLKCNGLFLICINLAWSWVVFNISYLFFWPFPSPHLLSLPYGSHTWSLLSQQLWQWPTGAASASLWHPLLPMVIAACLRRRENILYRATQQAVFSLKSRSQKFFFHWSLGVYIPVKICDTDIYVVSYSRKYIYFIFNSSPPLKEDFHQFLSPIFPLLASRRGPSFELWFYWVIFVLSYLNYSLFRM